MKNKKNSLPLQYISSIIGLFAAMLILVFLFMRSNGQRILDQNQQYLESSASQMAQYMDEQFDTSSMSVKMVSSLYEMQLDAPEFDYHLLNELVVSTPFDYIRFVGLDGISWSGEGRFVDASDREYYIEGIKGNSGICYIESSKFNKKSLIAFYTPLYFNGEIIGVVNGMCEIDHIISKMENDLFGRTTAPVIYLPDGKIAAHSKKQDIFPLSAVDADIRDEVISTIHSGEPITFKYTGQMGDGLAYAAPLAGGEFFTVQTFPSTIRQELTNAANKQTLKFELTMLLLFLTYMSFLFIFYYIHTKRLSREKNDLSQIVDSVKRLYRRFVIIDLNNDTYEYLEEGDLQSAGVSPTGAYSDWLNSFSDANSGDPEAQSMIDEMTIDSLRNSLTKEKWYLHRDYPTAKGHWERLSLIKLDTDSEITNKILGAVEDITDAKRRDEAHRQALETAFHAAESASSAKSEFLSRMSHDIRTPMNAIVGLTTIMEAHLDEPERMHDCLHKLTSSSHHLLSLINEVLDMSKIESGKLVLSEDEFSIPDMVDELLQIIQPNAREKDQTLTVEIVGLENENVIGDDLRLQQICMNILSNAVKYTQEGGHITMSISENRSPSSDMSEYVFVFRDNGIGMTPEFLERLFVPFERAEDERISTTQGTGLGMSIAQSMVHLMGGTIDVKSEPGKGSEFTVRVSLKPNTVSESYEKKLAELSILVVDDEEVICESTCLLLNEIGMKSEWVSSGKKAVARVLERHNSGDDFYAVILDWRMPGIDGIATAQSITDALGEKSPKLILSSYDCSDAESMARKAGVTAFVSKPLFKSRLRGFFADMVAGGNEENDDVHDEHLTDENYYSGKRVLLVEDNMLNQEIAKEILEMTGLTVEVAENGKIAVDTISSSEPGYYDIVFMDIQMPVMNGYEAAAAIRKLERPDAAELPIIALSANTFTDDVKASLDAGMNHHLGKPINIKELYEVLEKWLGAMK